MSFSVSPRQIAAISNIMVFLLLSPVVHAIDTDFDGLDDSVETNTGIYVSISNTGTDPNDPDTDSDTIPDALDLPPDRNPLVADWMVSAKGNHSCALSDNVVECWGNNDFGQNNAPVLINPVAVSAGKNHTCAMDDTGVVCWGDNSYGQTDVPTLTNPVAVSAGWYHTCALDDTGVVCWGDNSYGQTDTLAVAWNPVVLSAGGYHTCALDYDLGVGCWGAGGGALPDDGIFPQYHQSLTPFLENPIAVSAGVVHTCALDDTGVVCWGLEGDDPEYDNWWYGQTFVPTLSNPIAVSAGGLHTCAQDDTGIVCWGYTPITAVPLLFKPVAVSAGWAHTCALDDTGVVCWRFNSEPVPVLSFDKDLDGLIDNIEDGNGNHVVDPGETDPRKPDSDNDGLLDNEEDINGNGIVDIGETSPLSSDSDGDGLTDGYEVNVEGSDPTNTNTVYTDQSLPDPGDMNSNGIVDLGDLLLLQRFLLGYPLP